MQPGGGVTLSSSGNISYNADGEGDPDVYFSSSDLENLNTSLSTVDSSVSALTSRVGAAEADVTTIKNALGGGTGTELTTVMQNLLTGLNTKTGQNASTLQAAVNGMASLGSDVTYPEILPSGRSATDTGIRLNGYYNNKNLNVLMGGSYGINATTAASNEVEGKHTTSTSPYTQTTTDENASVLSITPQAGYYNGSTPIYVDLTNINNKYYDKKTIQDIIQDVTMSASSGTLPSLTGSQGSTSNLIKLYTAPATGLFVSAYGCNYYYRVNNTYYCRAYKSKLCVYDKNGALKKTICDWDVPAQTLNETTNSRSVVINEYLEEGDYLSAYTWYDGGNASNMCGAYGQPYTMVSMTY